MKYEHQVLVLNIQVKSDVGDEKFFYKQFIIDPAQNPAFAYADIINDSKKVVPGQNYTQINKKIVYAVSLRKSTERTGKTKIGIIETKGHKTTIVQRDSLNFSSTAEKNFAIKQLNDCWDEKGELFTIKLTNTPKVNSNKTYTITVDDKKELTLRSTSNKGVEYKLTVDEKGDIKINITNRGVYSLSNDESGDIRLLDQQGGSLPENDPSVKEFNNFRDHIIKNLRKEIDGKNKQINKPWRLCFLIF